jgi:hypothetical protein
LPYSIYNTLKSGHIEGVTVGTGLVFSLGNNPEAAPGKLSYTTTALWWNKRAGAVSVMEHFKNWIVDEPLAWGELVFRKLLLFWDCREIPNNISEFNRSFNCSGTLKWVGFISTSLFLVIFCSALFSSGRKIFHDKYLFFAFLLIFLYWLSIGGLVNLTRYRIPLIPLFALFSGIWLNSFFLLSRRGGGKKIINTLFAVAGALFLVYFAYPCYRIFLEKRVLSLIQPNGLVVPLDDKIMYIDHGPQFMGGYVPLPFVSGIVITKTLPVDNNLIASPVELQIQFLCSNENPFSLEINGEIFFITPTRRKMINKGSIFEMEASSKTIALFKIKIPENKKLNIKPLDISKNRVLFFIDTQRDYGRTSINGEKCSGEIVLRFFQLLPGASL